MDTVQFAQGPVRVSPPQDLLLIEGMQELADEKGIALPALVEIGDETQHIRIGQHESPPDEGFGLVRLQGAQGEAGGGCLADKGREQLVEGMATGQFVYPVGDEQQDGVRGERAGEEAEEVKGGVVHPVGIIEEKHERAQGGEGDEEIENLLDESGLTGNQTDGAAHSEWGGERRTLIPLATLVEEFDKWAPGRCLAEVVAPANEDERTSIRSVPTQRLSEGGLANPGFAADEDETPVSRQGGGQTVAQDVQFLLASDEQGWMAIRVRDGHGAPPHGATCSDSRWPAV
jgi:hypothetical protein